MLHPQLELFAPEHLLIETRKHLFKNTELQGRIGLQRSQIQTIFGVLTQAIVTVPTADYRHMLISAGGLAAHSEDAPYLALALWKSIPLWSNDKGMKLQSKVKIFTTVQLISRLSGDDQSQKNTAKEPDMAFGIWADHKEAKDVKAYIDRVRAPRQLLVPA